MPNNTKIQSNVLISSASQCMKDYRLSITEANDVKITQEDTGIIILLLLYFIKHEPKISRSKLEYYILLLDIKCLTQNGVHLFSGDLKDGHIRHFKIFIEFMLKIGLIYPKNRRSFFITENGQVICNSYFIELDNIKKWLDEILHDFEKATAGELEKKLLDIELQYYFDEAANAIRISKKQINYDCYDAFMTIHDAAEMLKVSNTDLSIIFHYFLIYFRLIHANFLQAEYFLSFFHVHTNLYSERAAFFT